MLGKYHINLVSLCSRLNVSSIIWSEVRRGNLEPTCWGFWVSITLNYCRCTCCPNQDRIALLSKSLKEWSEYKHAGKILRHLHHFCVSGLGLHIVLLPNTKYMFNLILFINTEKPHQLCNTIIISTFHIKLILRETEYL